jgi:hypothetical protein
VAFEPDEGGVAVELSLQYTITRRSPLAPLIDRFFVRRPITMSLSKTLGHFGAALRESHRPDVG